MGYEVEIKYRVPDHVDLAARLAGRGAVPGPSVDHEDFYMAHPARDFAQSGEAFRVRAEGDANAITYKGPKQGGPAKTREEIEVGFDRGAEARRQLRDVFERLGFRPVASVRKSRTTYRLECSGRPMVVTLDQADGLGAYAEVETLVEEADDLPKAQAAVVDLAAQLGLREVESRSYLRMALEGGRAAGGNPAGQA